MNFNENNKLNPSGYMKIDWDVPIEMEDGAILYADVFRPTSLHLSAGSRLCLTIKGNGPAHNDPVDRPAELFNNTVTMYNAPNMKSQLLILAVTKHNDHLGGNS